MHIRTYFQNLFGLEATPLTRFQRKTWPFLLLLCMLTHDKLEWDKVALINLNHPALGFFNLFMHCGGAFESVKFRVEQALIGTYF